MRRPTCEGWFEGNRVELSGIDVCSSDLSRIESRVNALSLRSITPLAAEAPLIYQEIL